MDRPVAAVLLAAVTLLTAAPDASAELLRHTMTHDGIEREYFVHVPPGGGTRLPVVVGLHGYTSTATGFAASLGLNRHADDNGYIAVYPQGSHFLADAGTGQPYRVTSWNDLAANLGPKTKGPHCTANSDRYPCPAECGECNRCAWTSCYDDIAFIDKVLDEVLAAYGADSTRVYVLGVSNGGMMALRLGCNRSGRFAAVASIVAQLAPGYECGPDTDLPMLHLYGGMDDTVRFDGTPGSDGFMYASAADTAKVWSSALACTVGPVPWQNEIAQHAGWDCSAHTNCRVQGHEVVGCMDPDGGHDWPGQSVASVPATCVTDEQAASMPGQARCPNVAGEYVHDGMDLVWQFLSRYHKEASTDTR